MKNETNQQEPQRQESSALKRLLDVYESEAIIGRLIKANELVKEEVKERSFIGSWRYADFVEENRFLDAIVSVEFDVEAHNVNEIVEYAINQIYT